MSAPLIPQEAWEELARLLERDATGEFRLQLYHGEIIGYKVVSQTKIRRTERVLAENGHARIR